MKNHSDLYITFLDSRHETSRFNTYKALGYEKLGASVTEGQAYMAGKDIYDEMVRLEDEMEKAEKERRAHYYQVLKAIREAKERSIKPPSAWLPLLIVICCGILPILAGVAYLRANELYNLICNNIFFIALFLIPSTIIFVGHKIETKKKQNSLII